MNKEWNTDEIIEEFTLSPSELDFLGSSRSHNRLGKALMLKFFQHEYRFPENSSEIPDGIIEYVAQQLDLSKEVIDEYKWEGRTLKEHRKEIRERMDFRPATGNDQRNLLAWLRTERSPAPRISCCPFGTTHLPTLTSRAHRTAYKKPN